MSTMLVKLTLLLLLSAAPMLSAADRTTLVPVFAEDVPGANGSRWRSEIRLVNRGTVSATVRLGRLFPMPGSVCNGFEPFALRPNELFQLKSIGCGSGAAALELVADDTIDVTALVTNVAPGVPTHCCYTGYTENVLTTDASGAYTKVRTLANLQLPLNDTGSGPRRWTRHNLGLINPNDDALVVDLFEFDSSGVPGREDTPAPTPRVVVPPRSMVQVLDLYCCTQGQFPGPQQYGYIRIEARAAAPFYMYDSQVDNVTNDATFLPSY